MHGFDQLDGAGGDLARGVVRGPAMDQLDEAGRRLFTTVCALARRDIDGDMTAIVATKLKAFPLHIEKENALAPEYA